MEERNQEPGEPERGARRPAAAPPARHLVRHVRVRMRLAVRRQVRGGARPAFRVDLAAMFLAGLYTGAVFPFIQVIARDDLGASPTQISLLAAAPFLGNLLALFWAQAMEGRRKMPFVLYTHLACRSMVCLSFAAVGAWPFALVLSSCQMIGSIATPAYAAIIKEVYPDDQRGTILGYTRAAILIAQIATTLAAGWAMAYVSYRVIFPIAGLIGMTSAVLFSRILPEEKADPAPAPGARPGLRQTAAFIGRTFDILREDRAYAWFALSVFTYGFGNLLTTPVIPLIQVDEMHIRKSQLAVLHNLMQVVAIGAYFYWGRYVDRQGPQKAVVISVMLNCLVPAVYIASAWTPGLGAWALLPAYVLNGIVMAGIDLSYFQAILTFAGPDNASRYQALQSFLLGIRGSVAPFIGAFLIGVLKDRALDLRWIFAVGLVFMLTGAWMQRVAMVRQQAHRAVLDAG